ncbi:DUF6292 family protein [Amycolatopsis pithecellobii]|uniref:DUF6292 domain-containing protein n=1 Tax=Amycolatopsis pithecellobii TaxID=664692 RepID=A0A6N7YR84_9PSEU|nr:DUF6292 family protein [Amycolatopsis pithecellobii]MTD54482.1 hypothetical protein [Amycolatopsis pithecellobii]
MKTASTFRSHPQLRHYVESVAVALGVEPAASLTEYGTPSWAYIALADTSPRHPGRLLMLVWDSNNGWALALEPERMEEHRVLASWPELVHPEPTEISDLVRRALQPSGARV